MLLDLWRLRCFWILVPTCGNLIVIVHEVIVRGFVGSDYILPFPLGRIGLYRIVPIVLVLTE